MIYLANTRIFEEEYPMDLVRHKFRTLVDSTLILDRATKPIELFNKLMEDTLFEYSVIYHNDEDYPIRFVMIIEDKDNDKLHTHHFELRPYGVVREYKYKTNNN